MFAAADKDSYRLWKLCLDPAAEPTPIATPPELTPVFPRAAGRSLLGFTDQKDRFITYVRDIPAVLEVSRQRPVASPSDEAEWAAFRHDNGAIAWAGLSNHEYGIWIQTGSEPPRRLGLSCPHRASELAWCPDNRHLAFTFSSHPHTQIWILDTQSGARRPLLAAAANQSRASWSPDGNYVYFLSDQGGGRRFHRARWPTLDQTTAITPPAIDGFSSPAGDSFLFLPNDGAFLMEMSPAGPAAASPRRVPNLPRLRKGHWNVIPNGIAFLDDFQGNDAPVDVLDWNSKARRHLARLPEWRPSLTPGTAVSPDRRRVLWTLPSRRESAWLLEGSL
ncbi:MAG: PD40 domain-containing protein [Bryobacterales bacterium]|nr:PD40 domain-containing protein [Bryobacterales bacterium]